MKVGITGHQALSDEVREFTSLRLPLLIPADQRQIVEGVSSLAVGSDQLFANYVLEGGGRLIVVVPSARYETTFNSPEELRAYLYLLSRATEVEQLTFPEPSEAAFMAAGRRVVDNSDWLLAIWDGEKSRGLGGTADIVAYAEERGKPVEVLWPAGVRRT